jgi:hypothetical protein
MTEPINQAPGPKIAPAVAVGSGSTQSPGNGYPPNPAEPAQTNGGPARGEPQQAQGFVQGIVLMSPCSTCGISYLPSDFPGHSQTHGTNFYREGSDFGSRNFSVDADLQTGRYSVGEQL